MLIVYYRTCSILSMNWDFHTLTWNSLLLQQANFLFFTNMFIFVCYGFCLVLYCFCFLIFVLWSHVHIDKYVIVMFSFYEKKIFVI